MSNLIDVAIKALDRQHQRYGETVRLLKHMPNATGGIYRQSKRMYEAPYEIRASVARMPFEEVMGRIGEESKREAELTIPVQYLRELFGRSTVLSETITTRDLIIFDSRVWRITQASFTGRLGDEPLIMYLLLREKLGEKETDYA